MESPVKSSDINKKREHYLEWAEYFMATAFLAAKRSKDPCSQVGACIVNEDNIIVGIGYNGMPKGCNDDEFPWAKGSKSGLENKYLYVCHAELNAVLNKNSVDVRNCTIYVGLFPCNECAKVIIQSGIRQVIYMSDKHAHKGTTIASKRMLDAVGVKYSQFTPKNRKITIDFDEINWNDQSQVPASPIVDNKSPRRMDSLPLSNSVVKHINLDPSTSNNTHPKKTKYENMNRSLDEAKLTPEEVHVKHVDTKDL